jgi:hypothetical protein
MIKGGWKNSVTSLLFITFRESTNKINLWDDVEYSGSGSVDAMYSQRHRAQPSSYAGSQLKRSPR